MTACPVCNSSATAAFATARDVEYCTSNDEFEYRQCTACDTVFLHPAPIDRLAEIYPPSYYSFTVTAAGGRPSLALRCKEWFDRRLFRRILQRLPGENLSVLDVGGGSGWILSLVRDASPRVTETHEIDIDARARDAAQAAGHVFHQTRVEDFLPDRRFDLIVMLNLIEHVRDPGSVLRKMRRLLADDGMLLIKTPNTDTLDRRLFQHRNWGGFHCPRHWVLFTRKSFVALARQSGLECVWARYTQGAPQWTNSLLAWLADLGWVTVSADRPMHTHPLHAPLLAVTAALDLARRPFMPTAQMFVLLRPAAAEMSAEGARRD